MQTNFTLGITYRFYYLALTDKRKDKNKDVDIIILDIVHQNSFAEITYIVIRIF